MEDADKDILASFVKDIAFERFHRTNEVLMETQQPHPKRKKQNEKKFRAVAKQWKVDRFVASRTIVLDSGKYHMYVSQRSTGRWELSWIDPENNKYVLPTRFYIMEDGIRVGNMLAFGLHPENSEDNESIEVQW